MNANTCRKLYAQHEGNDNQLPTPFRVDGRFGAMFEFHRQASLRVFPTAPGLAARHRLARNRKDGIGRASPLRVIRRRLRSPPFLLGEDPPPLFRQVSMALPKTDLVALVTTRDGVGRSDPSGLDEINPLGRCPAVLADITISFQSSGYCMGASQYPAPLEYQATYKTSSMRGRRWTDEHRDP